MFGRQGHPMAYGHWFDSHQTNLPGVNLNILCLLVSVQQLSEAAVLLLSSLPGEGNPPPVTKTYRTLGSKYIATYTQYIGLLGKLLYEVLQLSM